MDIVLVFVAAVVTVAVIGALAGLLTVAYCGALYTVVRIFDNDDDDKIAENLYHD